MPLTPFHLGPTFAIGLIFHRRINMAAILLSSTIIDVRTAYCFFNNCHLHGPLHTYIGAMIFAVTLSLIIYVFKNQFKKLFDILKINQNYSLKSIIIGGIIGAGSHVFFDSFMHNDITPFWPILENPFLGLISNQINYGVAIAGFLFGGVLYFYKFYKLKKSY